MISCIIGGIGIIRAVITVPVTYLYPYLTSTNLLNYIHLNQMPNNIFESPQQDFANAYKLYLHEILKQNFLTFISW